MKTRLTIVLGVVAAGLTALAYYATQPGNIGVAIGTRNADGPLHIALVFPGSPAESAGVKTNWCLISIDGTNVVSESSQRCMSMLHGVDGTFVTLELADPERKQTNRFTLKREDVKMPDDIFPFQAPTNTQPHLPIPKGEPITPSALPRTFRVGGSHPAA